MPLKASVTPSGTPRTAPCSVQTASASLTVQLTGCAAEAPEMLATMATATIAVLIMEICPILSVLASISAQRGLSVNESTNLRYRKVSPSTSTALPTADKKPVTIEHCLGIRPKFDGSLWLAACLGVRFGAGRDG